MKKIISLIFCSVLITTLVMTGCTTNQNKGNNSQGAVQTEEYTYPGKDGKVDPKDLDENNLYEIYDESDRDHQYPLETFECEDDGTIISGDIYQYDANHNVIKQTHYEREILDYSEVREYDEKQQLVRITNYAGEVKRENLVSSSVMEYDENGNEISCKTYDDTNALFSTQKEEYKYINGMYLLTLDSTYDVNNRLATQTKYSYRSDGTQSQDVRTEYDSKGEIKYYLQTTYDSDGIAVSYDYFDKNNKKIPEPKEERVE